MKAMSTSFRLASQACYMAKLKSAMKKLLLSLSPKSSTMSSCNVSHGVECPVDKATRNAALILASPIVPAAQFSGSRDGRCPGEAFSLVYLPTTLLNFKVVDASRALRGIRKKELFGEVFIGMVLPPQPCIRPVVLASRQFCLLPFYFDFFEFSKSMLQVEGAQVVANVEARDE